MTSDVVQTSVPTGDSPLLPVTTEQPALPQEVELRAIPLQRELVDNAEVADQSGRSSFFRQHALFIGTVVAPVLVTALWLFAIAAPRYVSEASFIVRSTTPNAADAFARAVQANTGAARAVDETYVVNNYLTSRDVVGLLVKNNDLRAILSRPQADFIFRYPTFWRAENSESLYRRFRWMVSADIDTATNISKVEVNAFRPEDARAITVALLGYAEELVNKLNARAYEDAQRTANRFVEIASQDIAAIEVELKDFRNASGVVDPSVEADAQLKLIAALWTALARVEATIAKNSALSPNNPGLKSLKEQARAYRETIEKRKLEMAGSSASMAAKLEKFDQLMLRRTLAVKTLESAVANREKARQDASQQHLYIQLVAKPSLSVDYATYPHSVRDILGVLVFSLIVFYLLNCLRQITSEHRT